MDEILAWGGRGQGMMAHVRWLGFDPATGDEWEDSWIPVGWLTKDLRVARPKQCKRKAGAEAEAARREGSRKSPRKAGLTPGPGLA